MRNEWHIDFSASVAVHYFRLCTYIGEAHTQNCIGKKEEMIGINFDIEMAKKREEK